MIGRTSLLAAVVATFALVAPASANDYHVEIVNKTGMALKHFYASVTSTDKWEEDILGRDVLEDGESFTAEIDDGSGKCMYDFKGVFENGQFLVQQNIDVCNVHTYTYTR